jgi:hypothetical protein
LPFPHNPKQKKFATTFGQLKSPQLIEKWFFHNFLKKVHQSFQLGWFYPNFLLNLKIKLQGKMEPKGEKTKKEKKGKEKRRNKSEEITKR